MGETVRLTMAQAVVRFLKMQTVERDGEQWPFFGGMFGIFGHGNVAGIGQALEEDGEFRYYRGQNEQGMVHAAAAYAKQHRRLRAMACTTSIGPGATNMVTGAAGATINRVPVLLLPGDIFARRNVGPVLQQLEHPSSQDVSVNDCFRPVSRYWDRINRPDQLLTALPEAMRVLTSPAETGAVTLSLPQDVQTEACDYPVEFFAERVHRIPRAVPEPELFRRAVEWIQQSRMPIIMCGGGVKYAGADVALAKLCSLTGIPVGETQAGKGVLSWDHPQNLGAIGHTGTTAANERARDADLVLCLGTRLSDFTTASKTLFSNPEVRFIGVNVTQSDAGKHGALSLVADARVVLTQLTEALGSARYSIGDQYADRIAGARSAWLETAREALTAEAPEGLSQGEVIAAVNFAMGPHDVVVSAAGSLPGDMHKLWRPEHGDQYHMEYGYSCMGYEIAGGLGIKIANPDGDVFVMVGDGSFLMMHSAIITARIEGLKLIIVLVNNHGFGSIHGLSLACGSAGFGNELRFRDPETGKLDGESVDIDFTAIAEGLGVRATSVSDRGALAAALVDAQSAPDTSVIVCEVDKTVKVPDSQAWWDVPVAEVSRMPSVQDARKNYEDQRARERFHF